LGFRSAAALFEFTLKCFFVDEVNYSLLEDLVKLNSCENKSALFYAIKVKLVYETDIREDDPTVVRRQLLAAISLVHIANVALDTLRMSPTRRSLGAVSLSIQELGVAFLGFLLRMCALADAAGEKFLPKGFEITILSASWTYFRTRSWEWLAQTRTTRSL
jgi:hypothetical protein